MFDETPYLNGEIHTEVVKFKSDAKCLAKLYVVEKAVGQMKMMPYHDATPIRYTFKWINTNGDEKPFVWEEVPEFVRNAIHETLICRKNPWPGCYWRDNFDGAFGDQYYMTDCWPIGD